MKKLAITLTILILCLSFTCCTAEDTQVAGVYDFYYISTQDGRLSIGDTLDVNGTPVVLSKDSYSLTITENGILHLTAKPEITNVEEGIYANWTDNGNGNITAIADGITFNCKYKNKVFELGVTDNNGTVLQTIVFKKQKQTANSNAE